MYFVADIVKDEDLSSILLVSCKIILVLEQSEAIRRHKFEQ